MADIKELIQKRSECVNDMLKAVVQSNGIDLIEALQDHANTMLDIDEALVSEVEKGVDISGYLTKSTVSGSGEEIGADVLAQVSQTEQLLSKEGWILLITDVDRERVKKILNPRSPRTSDGAVQSMVKTTANKEKLFARGKLLLEYKRPELAQPFFAKLRRGLGLDTLDISHWKCESISQDLEFSTAFELTDDQKVKTFDSLLLLARTFFDRKVMDDDEVENDALKALLSLLGNQALQATKTNGDLS